MPNEFFFISEGDFQFLEFQICFSIHRFQVVYVDVTLSMAVPFGKSNCEYYDQWSPFLKDRWSVPILKLAPVKKKTFSVSYRFNICVSTSSSGNCSQYLSHPSCRCKKLKIIKAIKSNIMHTLTHVCKEIPMAQHSFAIHVQLIRSESFHTYSV